MWNFIIGGAVVLLLVFAYFKAFRANNKDGGAGGCSGG